MIDKNDEYPFLNSLGRPEMSQEEREERFNEESEALGIMPPGSCGTPEPSPQQLTLPQLKELRRLTPVSSALSTKLTLMIKERKDEIDRASQPPRS